MIANLMQKVAELWNSALEGCALGDEAEGVIRVVDLEGDVNIAGDIPEECNKEVDRGPGGTCIHSLFAP